MWYSVTFEARRGQATSTRTVSAVADTEAKALLVAASEYEWPFILDGGADVGESCSLNVQVKETARPLPSQPSHPGECRHRDFEATCTACAYRAALLLGGD